LRPRVSKRRMYGCVIQRHRALNSLLHRRFYHEFIVSIVEIFGSHRLSKSVCCPHYYPRWTTGSSKLSSASSTQQLAEQHIRNPLTSTNVDGGRLSPFAIVDQIKQAGTQIPETKKYRIATELYVQRLVHFVQDYL